MITPAFLLDAMLESVSNANELERMQKKTYQKRLDGKLWISNVINCSKHKVFMIIPLSRSMHMVVKLGSFKVILHIYNF